MNHVGSEVDDGINLHVIKIGNIPWEVSSRDICGMIQPYLLQREPHQEWVHIPIDRGTGKTLSDLFVEIPTIYEAAAICSKLDRIIWKQRALTVTLSTYEELLSVHFNPSAMAMRQYITREDVSNIIGICRNYKIHFSRKCAERPFEHILSLVRLVPWHMIGQGVVELLFDMLKLGIEALVLHKSRPSCQIDSDLLSRMVQAGQAFPLFSRHQKEALQQSAALMSNWKIVMRPLNPSNHHFLKTMNQESFSQPELEPLRLHTEALPAIPEQSE